MKLTYLAILLLSLLPPTVAVLFGADQTSSEPTSTTDLFRTFGPAGTVGVVLALGVRWLASRLEASQSRLIDLLTGVIKENTVALNDIKNTVAQCRVRNENKQ